MHQNTADENMSGPDMELSAAFYQALKEGDKVNMRQLLLNLSFDKNLLKHNAYVFWLKAYYGYFSSIWKNVKHIFLWTLPV